MKLKYIGIIGITLMCICALGCVSDTEYNPPAKVEHTVSVEDVQVASTKAHVLNESVTTTMVDPPKPQLTPIEQFLLEDKTDEIIYRDNSFECFNFVRRLSLNAAEHNITIGGIILGYEPGLKGFNNHAMNYYEDNGIIYVIEPQTDFVCSLHNTNYSYYTLYPNGELTPGRWLEGALNPIYEIR